LIKDGDFPSPKKVRDRISVWDEREVDSWLEKTFLNPSLVEEGISND
jgi:predicted DNA-binding transcriptional regulator AlpA